VGFCELKQENTREEYLLVGLWSEQGGHGDEIKIDSGGATFSASGHAICELVNARWNAFWASVPDWSGPRPDSWQDKAPELHAVGPLDWQEK